MMLEEIQAFLLDAIPYPIVFVDINHVIKYLNKKAEYHYYQERGYKNLIGKSIFLFHGEESGKKIRHVVERFQNNGQEEFLRVNVKNERIYITPVRDHKGKLVGYFERYERNFTV